MGRTVAIGIQDFENIIINDYFYVDKTEFIREWWESGDSVTLIARPRRFGKTLTMSMVEKFFSAAYAQRGELFEKLSIWKNEKYRGLQGTYPVISLSFANVKEQSFGAARARIGTIIAELYRNYAFLRGSDVLDQADREYIEQIIAEDRDADITMALHKLSRYLYLYYGKKAIILLDEYDTPMQEAYLDGFWPEIVSFFRSMFNSTFKTNPWMERALMTGITRVSKESIFSDLNNLEVVTTTSDKYEECFGFTEDEVFAAMDECGWAEKTLVKTWYDGCTFGTRTDIYNPWSILNYLDTGKFRTYWANTSSNSLVGKLIREGEPEVKTVMEDLLQGRHLKAEIDEQIVFNQLDVNNNAIWSLLLASGYLKVISCSIDPNVGRHEYELALTNMEVRLMFEQMIEEWFKRYTQSYNLFVKAMMQDDLDAMNEYMNRVAMQTFSFFDVGKGAEQAEPERFYHGFVLGLMVDLRERYAITSNRKSGFGRYDIVLEPRLPKEDAIIIEFKVFNRRREKSLDDTLENALKQIDEKQYAAALMEKGIAEERIRKYGFAFEGKNVLIG